jgi:hypothetical protein
MNLKELGIVLVLATTGTLVGYCAHQPEPKVEERIVHETREVQVSVPVLTTQVIEKIVDNPKDKALISKLIKENNELKVKPDSITNTSAKVDTEGSGQGVRSGNAEQASPDSFTFKDFQLEANWTGPSFSYRLSQDFKIITSTGLDNQGRRTGLVRVYQETPDGPKEVVSSTTVFNAETKPVKWRVSARIQGGLGFPKTGVAVFQWLTRGSSGDPADLKFAVLSPAVSTEKTIGVLPISLNLGTIPKQPFTNLWLSPFIGQGGKKALTITATF